MRKLIWFFAGAASAFTIYRLFLKSSCIQCNEYLEVNDWEGEGGAVFDIADKKKSKLVDRTKSISKVSDIGTSMGDDYHKLSHQPDQKQWHFPKKID